MHQGVLCVGWVCPELWRVWRSRIRVGSRGNQCERHSESGSWKFCSPKRLSLSIPCYVSSSPSYSTWKNKSHIAQALHLWIKNARHGLITCGHYPAGEIISKQDGGKTYSWRLPHSLLGQAQDGHTYPIASLDMTIEEMWHVKCGRETWVSDPFLSLIIRKAKIHCFVLMTSLPFLLERQGAREKQSLGPLKSQGGSVY